MKNRPLLVVFVAALACAGVAGALFFRPTSGTSPVADRDGRSGALHTATPGSRAEGRNVSPDPSQAKSRSAAAAGGASRDPFRDWMRRYREAQGVAREVLLREGIALAGVRRAAWVELIPQDPERALAQSLSFTEWDALPAEVRELVEKPFSESVEYRVYPVCSQRPADRTGRAGRAVREEASIRWSSGGSSARAFVTGMRREIGSKTALPVQGITLAGLAAVRSTVFEEIKPEEAAYARAHFKMSRTGLARSFATGEPLSGVGIPVLSGGSLYAFANREELQRVEKSLALIERLPAPKASAGGVCGYPQALGAQGEWNPQGAESAAVAVSQEWTLGLKKLFMVRVRFANSTDQPPSQQDVEAMLNGGVAADIQSFSQGKASLQAAASTQVYTLPESADFYSQSSAAGYAATDFTSQNDALYDAAREVFSASKLGADAAVDLSAFTIVGVIFPEAGLKNGGLKYAGLASIGGGRLWMQGTNARKVYVHELGHVYGLYHSNFWEVNDISAAGSGAVVGPGSEREYGDIFDVMGDGEPPRSHFHPHAKRRIYWFDDSEIQSVTESGTFQVYRHDGGTLGMAGGATPRLRGLRIPKGTEESYWLGYRPAYAENASLLRGAYLLWQRAGTERCCLLDTTPGSAPGKQDAGLEIGRTYSDPVAGVHVTPLERGGDFDGTAGSGDSWLKVEVQVGDFSTNTAPQSSGIAGPAVCRARVPVEFSIAAVDAEEGQRLTYFWDAGDGSLHGQNGLGASTFSHAFVTAGSYVLRVSVSDLRGGMLTQELTVQVEDPALDWEPRNAGSSADFLGLAASPWLMVAVDGSDVIRTSPHGALWTARPVVSPASDLKFHAVIWAADQDCFVAVGREWDAPTKSWRGAVYRSQTGIDWERSGQAPNASGSWGSTLNFLASAPTGVVAAGYGGSVLFSADGKSWQALSLGPGLTPGDLVTGLAFGSGVFLLIAHPVEGGSVLPEAKIFASADGVHWNSRAGAAQAGRWNYLKRIFFLNDRFVASGMDSKLWVSSDAGVTFIPVLEQVQELAAAATGEGFFMAAGSLGAAQNTAVQHVLISVDGTRWVSVPAGGFAKVSSLAIFQDQIVMAGAAGLMCQSAALSVRANQGPAIEGVAVPQVWARAGATLTVSASDPEGDSLRYFWDAGPGTMLNTGSAFTHTWLSGGSQSLEVSVSDGRGGVARELRTFEVRDPLKDFSPVVSAGTQNLKAVTASESLLVAVGDKGEILTSTDGQAWTKRPVSDDLNLYFEAVSYGQGRFTAAGMDWDFTAEGWCGVVYGSSDGVHWSRVHKCPLVAGQEGSHLTALAYGNGKWIATGYGGTVIGSTDGVAWSTENVPGLNAAVAVADVAYGAGHFLAVGHRYEEGFYSGSPRVWALPDGGAWLLRDARGSGLADWQDFRRIRFVGDRFVAGGFHSRVRVSTDAGVSFTTTRLEEEQPRFLVWSEGAYFVFASDGYIEEGAAPNPLPVGVVSTDGVTWSRLALSEGLEGVRAGVPFKGRVYAVGDGGKIWRTGAPLRILQQPLAQKVGSGQDVVFSVKAAGEGALSYQWYWNDVPLSGATQAILQRGSVTGDSAGAYRVRISDESGESLFSQTVTLTVMESSGFVLVQNPEGLRVREGGSARLRVEVASTSGPITYVWRRDGIRVAGASDPVLTRDPVRLEDEGWYTVEVLSGAESVRSEPVFLRVLSGAAARALANPEIVRPPQGRVVVAGTPLVLGVDVLRGSGLSLAYQWYRNGVAVAGGTDRVLRIESAQTADQGAYTVRVIAEGGASVLSQPAWVTVLASSVSPSLAFGNPPVGIALWVGKSVALEPALNGTAAAYQWYRNGVAIPGAKGPAWAVRAYRTSLGASPGTDIYQLWAADSGGTGVLSEAIAVQPHDFSAWKGSFQGVLRNGEGRVVGRVTLAASALGSVSASIQWEAAVFRVAGRLQENLSLEEKIPGWTGSQGTFRMQCDPDLGAVAVEVRDANQIVGSAAACWRAVSRPSSTRWTAFMPRRSFLLESDGSAASGVLSGVRSPMGVVHWRREPSGIVWASGLLANGGVWTASSLWRVDDKAAWFARVSRPMPRPAGWVGGVFSPGAGAAEEELSDWCQPAGGLGDFSAGFRVRLRIKPSDYAFEAFKNLLSGVSSRDFEMRTPFSPGPPQTVRMRGSAAGRFLSSGGASPAFASLRLSIDRESGWVRGVWGDPASAGRLEWTGLVFGSDTWAPFGVSGFVRRGEWIAPFEIVPGATP